MFCLVAGGDTVFCGNQTKSTFMKKIVLTGFKPFAPYKFNPTEQLAEFYNDKIIGNIHIVGIVLPCTYFGAFQKLKEIIRKEKPYAIISTGLASLVQGIRIETVFRNLMNGKYPDAEGLDPRNKKICIDPDTLEFISSTANNIHLANLLSASRIPVEVSANADSFICNSLGYLTSKKIMDGRTSAKNMFIHIPWTDDYKDKIAWEKEKIFLNKDLLYKAIELLVQHI